MLTHHKSVKQEVVDGILIKKYEQKESTDKDKGQSITKGKL